MTEHHLAFCDACPAKGNMHGDGPTPRWKLPLGWEYIEFNHNGITKLLCTKCRDSLLKNSRKWFKERRQRYTRGRKK